MTAPHQWTDPPADADGSLKAVCGRDACRAVWPLAEREPATPCPESEDAGEAADAAAYASRPAGEALTPGGRHLDRGEQGINLPAGDAL